MGAAHTAHMTTDTVRGYRPILHIHVTDGLTGKLLVDVDSPSVASGLAYYLLALPVRLHARSET